MVNLDPAAKKGLVFLACLGLALVVLAFLLLRAGSHQVTAKYKEEIALAKEHGMVVDEVDLAAFNPKIPDAENAAVIYRQLEPTLRNDTKVIFLIPQPYMDATFLEDIRLEIRDSKANLALIEKAVEKDKCWIDLSFHTDKNSISFSLDKLSRAVKTLLARAVVSKMRGDDASALKDLRMIDKVAQHIVMSKDLYGFEIAEAMQREKSNFVAAWAAELPPGSIWHKEFERATKTFIAPSRRDLVALDLYEDLQASEATRTWQQRRDVLGFKDSEEEGISPLDFASRSGRGIEGGLAKILRGRRMIWSESAKEDLASPLVMKAGEELVAEGLRANPWLEKWRSMRRKRSSDHSSYKFQKLAMQAVLRVLAQEDRSKVPSMAGLVLPPSARPPRISYLSNEINIMVESTSSRRPEAVFSIVLKPKQSSK